ncbi:hypothetical protein [Sphingobacterium bovistauri]|uniref:Uncharacterized protein n=1 Tax=Sphingobacterium bovistauri TaxID=2781959 RepID=A0ABS7Z4B9_9SPHI|nr:hypothetical protein [Sphingobacterium bovistauri]MCA5003614.1 hypothetical protein [Sphingobacterium bovistauri]
MKMFYTFILILILFPSCKNDTRVLDFGDFTIEVPKTWKIIKQQSIDSYVGTIAIDERDTIYFDLGWYSNNLDERKPYEIKDNKLYLKNLQKSTNTTTYFDYIGEVNSVDTNKYLKNKYSFDTINNRLAKIVTPKIPEDGTTGIYMDSLWEAGSGVDRFQLNGKNLSRNNHDRLLKAIKTLKFKSK